MAQLNFDATALPVQTAFQLLMQVDNNHPTEAQILNYLHALHAESGDDCISVDQFYSSQAFHDWQTLITVKPAEMPANMDVIHIRIMLNGALKPFHCPILDKDIVTFQDRVDRGFEFVHMLDKPARGIPKSKQNIQEAQKRYRLRQRNDGSPEAQHAHALKAAHDEYISRCRQRKEAMEQWAKYVSDAKLAWDTLRASAPPQSE